MATVQSDHRDVRRQSSHVAVSELAPQKNSGFRWQLENSSCWSGKGGIMPNCKDVMEQGTD